MSDDTDTVRPKLSELSADIGTTGSFSDRQPGSEELLEDILGLNKRSLRSLTTLFVSPADYFAAAKTIDWGRYRFTPSPRLWLGLIAITVATQFIWGKPDGSLMTITTQQIEAGFMAGAGEDASIVPDVDWRAVVQRSFDLAMLIQPFIMMAMMMMLATFLRFWGEPLTYIVRLRYLFAIIIPASVINMLATFLLLLIPPTGITLLSLVQILVILIFYVMTTLRGPFAGHPRDSAIPKSIVIALILFVAVMITSLIAQSVALLLQLVPIIREAAEAAHLAA
ncbi:hypothetical protein ACFFUB_12270 [Algimonas porphyrae]|uniref:Yip1 domain-containing protein n=1 Tax=Algimonas porphyrae TaxID=1128113 RepID=A0ABQ5UV89_9PROT|nr:hypothetical protein [Algimonas porphyrae]GLQ19185.1 hypothetical protein GCM10007854_01400 [Algimonas porphyrae]